MQAGIIIAIIGAVPALVTAIVSIVLNNRVLNVRLESLQKQFDKLDSHVTAHNSFMERIAVLERDDKTAFNRIDELREEVQLIKK